MEEGSGGGALETHPVLQAGGGTQWWGSPIKAAGLKGKMMGNETLVMEEEDIEGGAAERCGM